MISVIIPIYNSEPFLERTLQSVLNQTYSDFEVIMVDDGSTDNSAIICGNYAHFDKRFKYYFKENSGVADARNLGLKKVKGKYISFLDSDDSYDRLFLEKLLSAIVENNVAIAACNMYGITKDEKKISSHFGLKEKRVILSDTDFCSMQNFLGSASLCNKIYKKEVFNNITFPPGILFEDNYVFHEIFGNSRYTVAIVNEYLYNYHYNTNSITRKDFSFQRYQDYISGLIRRLKFFNVKRNYKLAAAQTKAIILDEMIKYILLNEEVKHDRLTRKFLIRNLFDAKIHYKTMIMVYIKIAYTSVIISNKN